MSFSRGLDGFMANGGYLNPAVLPVLNSGYSATVTTISLNGQSGQPLKGVIAAGDTFTIAGESGSPTHTVTGGPFYIPASGLVPGLTFTPGIASGGVSSAAVLTFNTNLIAQVTDWNFTATLAELKTDIMGSVYSSVVGGLASWSGTFKAFLDYSIPTQAELINLISGNGPLNGVIATLVIGVDRSGSGAKFFYGASVLKSASFVAQINNIVETTFSYTGSGPILPSWQ